MKVMEFWPLNITSIPALHLFSDSWTVLVLHSYVSPKLSLDPSILAEIETLWFHDRGMGRMYHK